jgi:uncharacterized protein
VRLVLDTNIWLDWLVFADPSIGRLQTAVAADTVQIFIDAACLAELERVLAYPLGKHTIDPAAQAVCLAEVRLISHLLAVEISEEGRKSLPACRDPNDQKFLEAALLARADLLVTKDQALLELARRKRPLPFRIVTPSGFSSP